MSELEAPLSAEQAYCVIEPYFVAIQIEFSARGYDRVSRVKLQCERWVHDTPRHFAGCSEAGDVIVVAPELADLPNETLTGILAHELGHATDFLYPAEFVLRDRSVFRRDRESYGDKQWRQLLSGWKQRDVDAQEFTADGIAELVLGVPIGYSGPCLLQNLASGRPRPLGLR